MDDKSRHLLPMLKRIATLSTENIKLVVTERLAVLCSTLILVVLLSVIAGFALLFLSLGCVRALTQVVGEHWAYALVGGGYLIAGVILLAMRRCAIENPVARFLSRLILGENYKSVSDDAEDGSEK